MATRLYGVSLGETIEDVVEGVGSATSADDVEVTVDFAVVTSKLDAVLALKQIIAHIEQNDWPPA